MRNTISPSRDVEAQVRERLAPVRVALADALEADHVALASRDRVARRRRPSTSALANALRIEGAEVLGLLADADEADRQSELACDRDHDAAARGAIELGQHQARDAERGVKLLRLRQRVLALIGIEHQQHLVRRLGHRRAAMTRLTFLSSSIRCVWLCSRPAVSASSTSMPRACADLSASKITAPGSAPVCCALNSDAGALGPDVQLFDGGGAEGIAGGEQHAQALRRAARRASLPMLVVLPEPLTPTISTTNGLVPRVDLQRLLAGLEHLGQALAQRVEQRLDIVELVPRDAAIEICQDLAGGLDADIGGQQARLEILEHRGVDLAPAQQAAQVARDRGAAAIEARLEAGKETSAAHSCGLIRRSGHGRRLSHAATARCVCA